MAAPRKENIKEIILNATCALLEKQALADISLAQIAAAAGVSKGTLYYHYKTKGEIFFDITDRYLNEQMDDFVRWTENKEKDTSIQRLVKYVAKQASGKIQRVSPKYQSKNCGTDGFSCRFPDMADFACIRRYHCARGN